MSEWIKASSTGVRYRLHPTRKHGVGFDKYFTIRYKIAAKEKSEGLGWASEGWSEKKAAAVLAELKANHTTGEGPRTLAEKRTLREKKEREETERAQKEKARNITFGEIFTNHYFPQVQHNRRNPRSIQREEALFRLWIAPVIGNRPIREVMPLHLEKIKRDMGKAGRSAASIRYCLAVVRQAFNYALKNRLFSGMNPADKTGGVKRPTLDNRRTRFLTREEAEKLLQELAKRSTDVHDIALFSLYTGSRAGEVFNLQWGSVDLQQGIALLKETKSGKNRPVFLADRIKTMLAKRCPENIQATSLVFPGREGKKIVQISDSFNRAVDKLNLNEGVVDRLMKVTFHTLRHTFASWLAMDGINPFHLKELLGHSDLKLTERYSHLSVSSLRDAALRIQNG